MTRRLPAALCVLAIAAHLSSVMAAPGSSGPAQVTVEGRTATVALPYRSADNLVWVSATRMSEAGPWMFKGLTIKPREGPQGTDLAVFSYTADRPGTAVLSFGLVPPGKMLIGPPSMVYTGPVAQKASVELVAK